MQINFKNVTYIYNANTPFEKKVLKNINLDIEAGSFTTIIGKTGSGKSTLIQHLNGILIPDEGFVKVGNLQIEKKKKKLDKKNLEKSLIDLRQNVALLFQFSEQQLFEKTVLEDIIFGPLNYGMPFEKAVKIAKELIKLVGLKESYLDISPFELSGGEMRKVALCGVLALNPKVLVLDEPTIGLDYKSKREFIQLINKIYKEHQITIIFITHNMDYVLENASNIVVMKNGEVIISSSSKEELINLLDMEENQLLNPEIIRFQKKLISGGISLSRLHYNYSDLLTELIKLLGDINNGNIINE